jgi:hypothetical protein
MLSVKLISEKEESMNRERKFLELLGDVEFKPMPVEVTQVEFRRIAEVNLEQYTRLEAKGKHHLERVQDLVSLMLGEKLLPMCLDKFGDNSDYSLRRLLEGLFYSPEMESGWDKYEQMALESLGDSGFKCEQLTVIQELLHCLPSMIIDYMVEQVGRLKNVPMQEVPRISSLLAQMMKESGHGYSTGNN